ncbi:MAG: WD40/YVTN/BNR-like repeat-containing protein [Solirubrobacteraceae bacterium]
MSRLLVGTKKGLFILDGEAAVGAFSITRRAFAGEPVDYATRDPSSGRLLATTTSPFYGPKIFHSDGHANGDWEQAEGVALPEGGDQALERIWVITPGDANGTVYAGGDPGVLFESHDGGQTWTLNDGLWDQPSRADWQPGGGGLCLHSICPWPGDPQRLAVAISAAGMWLTEDAGRSWERGNIGLNPRYLPEETLANPNAGRCVHHIERAPERPERMFMQFHGGVYRSDDAGASWTDIGGGDLPSDFGFPLMVDPADPDSAYLIPLVADMDRVTPDGRVRVYETRDAGATWTARGDGLPAEHAYVTVLRQAFSRAKQGDELELYFGTTTGEIFCSGDAGATWATAASRLPPVYSVVAVD